MADSPPTWINDGEKYALLGLDVDLEGEVPSEALAPNLWTLSETRFDVPEHWKEWIGTIRADEVASCDLFLLSKLKSKKCAVLDEENQQLQRRVWQFYVGLMLTGALAPRHKPVILTGAYTEGVLGIRQHQDLEVPIASHVSRFPPVTRADIERGAYLGEQLAKIKANAPGGAWRLFRVLNLYINARTVRDNLQRLHQFCRCIDGLILSEPGKTKRQFKSRTELFIGPGHHEFMGRAYDARSTVEHLNEDQLIQEYDRALRIELLKTEGVLEYIARTCLARIISEPTLWSHFANVKTMAPFWAKSLGEQRNIWGKPIDPFEPLKDFEEKYIRDSDLGGPE